jgi:hypothetical protein
MTPHERALMHEFAVASTAGLIGWFCCAMFASVAYNWTFYYLLGLLVAAREIIAIRRRADA